MKFVLPVVLMIVLLAEVAAGQKAQPGPVLPSVAPKTEEAPTPSGTPEPQAAPVLLPESNQLPAEPTGLGLPSEGSNSTSPVPAAKQPSPEEQEKNRARLVEIRAVAMRNARVVDLLKEANGALTDEAKREFMRAYYHTLCTRMRTLEPTLSLTINEFERAEIRKLAAGPSRLSIVARDLLHKERQRHARRSE